MFNLKRHETYSRNIYKWVKQKKVPNGTCDYTIIRTKGDRVDFYYISDTDNVNHGHMTIKEFIKELASPDPV